MKTLTFIPRSSGRVIGSIVLALSLAAPMGAAPLAPTAGAEAVTADAVVEGRVMDQTGASLSGVKVILIGATTRQTTTDREGRFKISVPEGSYVLTAEKAGFTPHAAANLEVKTGVAAPLEIRLEVSRSEDITVEEQASAVSLDASQNAGAVVLKDGDLEALPDDPDELASYLQSLAGNSGGPNGGQIYIDGFTGGRVPNKASIREIRLNSNPFSSEFDRMGFGRIEIITRPGTDRYRGGASFRFNNDALNTRNPYGEKIKPHYQREDYSIDFAGPIAQGKASFAFDSDYRTVDGNDTINAVILDENLVSTPFIQTVVRPTSRLSFSPRIDWQISEKQSLTVRYSHSENETLDSGIGNRDLPSRGFDSKNSENSGDFTLNSILGSKVNEIRMRFSKSGRNQKALDPSPTLVVQDSFTSGGAAVGISTNDGTRFELTDVVSWATRKHAFRAGFRVRRNTTDETSRNNFAGVVTFAGGSGPELDANFNPIPGPGGVPNTVTLSSLERYRRTLGLQARGLSPAEIRALGGGATQYLVAGGNPVANVSQTDLGVFFNDDWKKTDRLVLGLGLRAEIQNNINTRLELAPRLSFAYSLKLDKDGRTPKTVTRGGIGVFYDRVGEGLVLDANRYLGGGRLQYLVTDTAILDQIRVSNGAVTSVPTVDALNRFSQPQNTRVLDEDVRAPRSIQGSLSLEQQFGKLFTGSLTVIASRGDNQLRSRNINAIRADGTRPLAVPGAVYAYETTGRNRQFQVVTGLATRPGQRNSFFVRYFLGWAKGDTDGSGTFPANPNDIAADWGRASSDVRHRVMAGGNIRGPWNISIGPMITISTGRPYNITTGRDLNFDTVFSDRPSFGVAGQPGVIETEYGALDTTGSGVIIPRNYGEGPGFASVSLRISKTIPFKKTQAATPQGGGPGMGGPMGGGHGPGGGMGGMRGGGPGGGGPGLTLSLSVSNLLDRINPSTPVGNMTSPDFGQSKSLAGFFMGFGAGGFGGGGGGGEAGNRRIELQARLTF
ncbi:MAG: TonB-dependent receptor [Vicinamibacteria bacterium]|nr:TonB-dependent receptor [Vicinamibacteria bacterium]